jgi:hypothetical protein
LLLLALLLPVRLPFLNQAVGGDDVYYLAAAYHGLIDPLHPNHTSYVFEGNDVTFQGYPHPPGNAWFLSGLLRLFGDVHEVPFNAAYLLFSLLAVAGMYALARRFSTAPFWATALFIVVPAFCVNGNLLESDVPLAAFWLSGAAAFIWSVDRGTAWLILLAGALLACSGLIAMQSAGFGVILLGYLVGRRWTPARVIAALAPFLTLAAWQVFERVTSGVFPFAVSAGYMKSYGYESLIAKAQNVLGLSVHSLFIVFPLILIWAAPRIWRERKLPDTRFLLWWCGAWLVAAWVLFYSGSARYLLPMAPAVVILATRAPIRWVRATWAVQFVISFGLAVVSYQHWNGYRQFVANTRGQMSGKRVWVDSEWGLRHYLEADGALPSHRFQSIPTGDIVVESELAYPAPFAHGGRILVPVAEQTIDPALPFRLIGIDSASGYSTASKGNLPYGIAGGVIDRIHAYQLRDMQPTLSRLSMNAPEAESQILYGIYSLEQGAWRWTSGHAAVLLKNPGHRATLTVRFFVPEAAKARTVRVSIPGGLEKTETIQGSRPYTITLPVQLSGSAPVTVKLDVDGTFQPPGDHRDLGVILNEVALTE